MEIVLRKMADLQQRLRHASPPTSQSWLTQQFRLTDPIKNIGVTSQMGDYEKRKLRIFNLLNFLQLLYGIAIPIWGLSHQDQLPPFVWKLYFLPAFTSLAVLLLNYWHQHEWGRILYFILYPFLTCIVFLNGFNAGVTLHFILFGVLSVFFLKDIGFMLFTVSLSMMSYFILDVVLERFIYEVKNEHPTLYLVNQGLALLFIFYGLFLVKRENSSFQFRIIRRNKVLHKKNIEIQKQNVVIAHQLKILDRQKRSSQKSTSSKTNSFR